jgi:hypothetical protein
VALGDPPGPAVAPAVGLAAGTGAGQVDSTPPRPWYRRWWVWTIAAAVVGGGVATAVVLTRPAPAEPPRGTLPTVQLP